MAEQPIILFDGVCNFCNASVNFLIDHDRRGRLRFASQQSIAGRRLMQRHRLPPSLSTLVMIEHGRASMKWAAILRIVRYLPFPWPFLQAAAVIPRSLGDAAYDLLAANRYRWFGRTDACRLPAPETAWRFLKD